MSELQADAARCPTKSQEVKVHAPEEFAGGGRSTTGKLAHQARRLHPRPRSSPSTVALIVAAVLVVLADRLAGRSGGAVRRT